MVWRKLLSILCLVPFLIPAGALAEPYEHPYPEALQMSVETEARQAGTAATIDVRIPVTCNETVNHALRESANALYTQMLSYADCRIDMMATYRVSGTKWAGFLLTGRAVLPPNPNDESQTFETTQALYYDVQTYDMETGEPLTLRSVFSTGSTVWTTLTDAARELLYSYYPDEMHDEEALEAMVAPEALQTSAFLPGAGQLLVPFSLEAILPDHKQIVYLVLPYHDYRSLMTAQALKQTDNSTRPIICLTLDDGPNRIYTQRILEELTRFGASATFFCVGRSIKVQPDMLRREMDYGNVVAAHSMTHVDPWKQSKEDMLAEYDEQKALSQAVTGIPVSLLRPPGGDLKTYVTRQIGWPLIRWNKSGSDTGDDKAKDVARRVIAQAAHGDIFLMHDIKAKTADAMPILLEALQERGYMFATVTELLYLNGITPQPNVAYYDALGQRTYSKDE